MGERLLDTVTPENRKPLIHYVSRCENCLHEMPRASEMFAREDAAKHSRDFGHSVQVVEVSE